MKRNLFQAASFLLLILGVSLKADEPLDADILRAEIGEITEAGRAPLQIRVLYGTPSGVTERSFDDSDLWVTSADGFHAGVTFIESQTTITHPDANGDIPPGPITVALYELAAPRDGWTEDDNGEYAVILAGGEVMKNNGEAFEMALVGAFSVLIGEEKRVVPALAGEISVETFATPGAPGGNTSELAVATLTVTFPYPVEVDWGRATYSGDTGFCVEVVGYDTGGFVPQVLTTYTHRVELGMLERGNYQASLKSGEGVLHQQEFSVGGINGDLVRGLPSEVEIEIIKLPTRGLYPNFVANIRMTFDRYVDRVDWEEVSRRESVISSEMTAWIDPRIQIFAPMVVEHQVGIGMLFPGEYRYEVTSLGEVLGRVAIVVPALQDDFLPPRVTVHGATVTEAGDEALEFSVEFFDDSELSVEGIEAQVLSVMNRRGEMIELERTGLHFTADLAVGAIATYRMLPPGGAWDANDSGRYRLLLSEPELVVDMLGNHLTEAFIGYVRVAIEPDDPEPTHTTELRITNSEVIGRWAASVRLFVPEDLAVRDDWEVDWGKIRASGSSFILRPRFVLAGTELEIGMIPPSDTTGAGMWVEHDYDIGPISEGSWVVCLNSNLGHFAKERLIAGDPERLIEPFDAWSDWADRAGGVSDQRLFWEYCVGTDPGNPSDDHDGDPRPEVIEGEDGRRHLGLRCQMATAAIDARMRFEGSEDMLSWEELGPDQIEEVERIPREDGIEEFVVCLVDDLGNTRIRYLRVVAERW